MRPSNAPANPCCRPGTSQAPLSFSHSPWSQKILEGLELGPPLLPQCFFIIRASP